MSRLDAAIRDLADTDQEAPGAADRGGSALRVLYGAVASIAVAGAADGHDQVTVSLNGSSTPAPYLESYSPRAVGDVVAVLLVQGSPLILGRRVGLPSF